MPIKTNLILFTIMTLSTGAVIAMEEDFYKMTIENQRYVTMFLNVEDPTLLANTSSYPHVKSRETKTFLLSKKEIANQSIAFPSHWPSDKVKLPIEKKETYFIIKNDPTDNNKSIVEDDSKNIIAELLRISYPK